MASNSTNSSGMSEDLLTAVPTTNSKQTDVDALTELHSNVGAKETFEANFSSLSMDSPMETSEFHLNEVPVENPSPKEIPLMVLSEVVLDEVAAESLSPYAGLPIMELSEIDLELDEVVAKTIPSHTEVPLMSGSEVVLDEVAGEAPACYTQVPIELSEVDLGEEVVETISAYTEMPLIPVSVLVLDEASGELPAPYTRLPIIELRELDLDEGVVETILPHTELPDKLA